MVNNEVNESSEGRLYITGTRGYSAYEVAVLNGYEGTEEEWLASLKGDDGEQGPQGKSAYQVAVDNGYIGTEEDWTNSFLSPDGYIQKAEVVDNLNGDATEYPLSAKQGKMLNLEKVGYDNFPNFFLGVFFHYQYPYKTGWYISLDGENYSKIPGLYNFGLRDPSLAYDKTNHIFYCAATTSNTAGFRLYKSTDLVNWTSTECAVSGLTGGRIWAPDLYFDNSTGILYCILSNEYSSTETDINGTTIPAFDQYITHSISLDNMTFTAGQKINLSASPNRNHIDGSLCKINGTWYLTVKNEYSKVSEIFSSSDLTNWNMVNSNVTKSMFPLEGQMLVETEDEVYYFADGFGSERYITSKAAKSDIPNFENKFIPLPSLKDQRHGSIMYVDTPEVKKLVTSLPGFNLRGSNALEKVTVSRRTLVGSTAVQEILNNYCVLPNDIVIINGSGSLTMKLRNPFKEQYFSLMFAASDGASVTITHIDGYQLATPIVIVNNRIVNENILRIPLDYYALMNYYHRGTQKLLASDISIINGADILQVYSSNTIKTGDIVSFNITLKLLRTGSISSPELIGLPAKYTPITSTTLFTSVDGKLTINTSGKISGAISGGINDLIQITGIYVSNGVIQ